MRLWRLMCLILLGLWSNSNNATAQNSSNSITSPLQCFQIRVTNLTTYTRTNSGGPYPHGFTSHVLPAHEGYSPPFGFDLEHGQSAIIAGYVYGDNNFGDNNLIEISSYTRDPSAPNSNAQIRIELGPNLKFVTTSNQDVTVNMDADHPFRDHLTFIRGIDCAAAQTAQNKPLPKPPSGSPAPLPPHSSSPVACPHLQEIRDGVREINAIAARLESDDSYYQSAVVDMLARGYESGFARITFGGPEASITQTFSTPAKIQTVKPAVADAARATAQYRQQLATAMFVYSQGQTYHPPDSGDEGINAGVAAYLCSADPTKMTIPSWDALYRAGYIAAPFHQNVKAHLQTNEAMDRILIAATVVDVAPVLGMSILRVAGRAFAVDAGELSVLKTVAGGSLAFSSPETIGTVVENISAEDFNLIFEAVNRARGATEEIFPPFEAGSRVFAVRIAQKVEFVRFFNPAKDGVAEGQWIVRRELVVDSEGNWLPAKEIWQKLALKVQPTHVVTVELPADTEVVFGRAAEIKKWGVVGGEEQGYIRRPVTTVPDIKFGKPEMLTR